MVACVYDEYVYEQMVDQQSSCLLSVASISFLLQCEPCRETSWAARPFGATPDTKKV